MILVTTEYISGRELETLGLVKGSTIQTVNVAHDIGASLKTLIGGELKRYNEMMADARDIATQRMIEEAQQMGADAIVDVRYTTSSIMQSAAEVMVYGTAVKYR
ncbi:YbjQ family protein [Clostridium vitabionis]|uniref:YbjQ family protein n=1 Tax=Clostridium vitabionis TaxID=2784388 RepID=UPI00188D0966|nr:YbjQ family protein [Clostridium vitabionis]